VLENAAATVLVCKVHTYQAESPTQDITGYSDLLTGTKHRTFSTNHLTVTNKTKHKLNYNQQHKKNFKQTIQ